MMKQRAETGMRISVLVLLVLFIAMALVSCGSGGGGGGAFLPPAKATFTKTYGTSTGDNAIPFANSTFGDVTYQGLYTAAQIGASGKITKLRYQSYYDTGSAINCPNTTIRLGHSSLAALGATFATNINVGSATVVLNNATVKIPAGAADSWFEIPLATPFEYDGVNNLVVQIDRTTACSATFAVTTDSAPANQRAASLATDATPGTADNNTTTAITTDIILPLMQFVFTGGDDTVSYGAPATYAAPFSASVSYRHVQMLHPAASINGSGLITGIGMVVGSLTTGATYTATIKLGHAVRSTLTDTYADNFDHGSPVTVANNVAFTVPANVPAGSTLWLPITGSFTYNGRDNLIVDVDVTDGSLVTTDWAFTDVAGGRSLFGASGNSTGNVDTGALHTKFRFNGGRMSKLSANTGNNNTIFNGAYSSATLYSATDLGTAGKITSVACRLRAASTEASYADFKVVMGHAAGSTLSGTAATDFASQKTVYSGTFAVPAGLAAGDWLDIPLSSSFAYDGKSNLIVWMGNGGSDPGTAVVNYCMGESNATRYPSGMGVSTTGVGSAGYTSVINWTTDIRMTVQK